ncbi:MAG: MBL fold metallo-hydrolase [Clostridium sp.]|jgi:phosphoribosyl 1,2-cyclic phosphodiesterase|nr:MBL fold metallo-hydrolase [Clostridium sp.]
MRLCSIASGSSGNCIYVGSQTAHVLVDAGISGQRTQEALTRLDLSVADIDAIFITHEHSDHVQGLSILEKKRAIPIYATEGTIATIQKTKTGMSMDPSLFVALRPDEKISIKDLQIHPMKISHDAADPVAYRISYGKTKIGICTDLGAYDDYTVESLRGMDALLLEANHDMVMLQRGSYPYRLKQRILGERGHLSNEACGRLLCRLLHDGLRHILLGHLSQENNLPSLAYEAVRLELTLSNSTYVTGDFPIQVASRSQMTPVISL